MATNGQKFKTFTNEERTEIVSKYMSGKYSYAIFINVIIETDRNVNVKSW